MADEAAAATTESVESSWGSPDDAATAPSGWSIYSPARLDSRAHHEVLRSRDWHGPRSRKRLENILLPSNYIWAGNEERKKLVTSIDQLTKEEKQRAAYVILALVAEHYERAPFARNNLVALYQNGSRVWKTAEPESDWDFILVIKEYPMYNRSLYQEFVDVNVVIFSQELFQEKLSENPLDIVACLFLPEEHVWYDSGVKWEFVVTPDLVCESLTREIDRTQYKAGYESMRDFKKSKKFLLHSLRFLSFAVQLLEHGKLVDLGEVNYFWAELKTLEYDDNWLSFLKEKYIPEYKRYRNKFRLLYSEEKLKERKENDTITTTTTMMRPLWRRRSNWLRSLKRVMGEDRFDSTEESERKKEESALWMSFLYPRQRTTLRMQCVDIVIENMLRARRQHKRTKKEGEQEKQENEKEAKEEEGKESEHKQEKEDGSKAIEGNEDSWKQLYIRLPKDLKELLWEELVARHLALHDLREMIGPKETEEEKKEREEEETRRIEANRPVQGFGRGRGEPRRNN